jgi:nucleotidyltransferase/DNA polymerase involved in DNA repair
VQWVCYLEVQGLYAAAARSAGLVPPDRLAVVMRDGRVFDGCREAFAGGLVLGAPARQVLRDAPRAVQVDLAELDCTAAAKAWWDRCLAHTPYVEPGEPHQLFLSLPAPGDALASQVKAEAVQIMEEAAAHGFVAFMGVASSKLVARAAALACKEGWLVRRPGAAGRCLAPETAAFVAPGEEQRFLAPLPVGSLPASPEVLRRLGRLGLRTIGEAGRIPEGEWLRQLGPLGRQVALWSQGVDPEPVRPCYPARSLERRVEFPQEVRDRDHLEQVAGRSAAMLSRQLAAKGEGAQQVELILERPDGPPLRASRTLQKLQQAPYPLQQAVQGLLGQVLEQAAEELRATALAVEFALIGPMPWQQLNLWDDPARSEREERLQRALQLLHERFPPRLVGLGPRQDLSWREQMLQFADPYRWAGVTT